MAAVDPDEEPDFDDGSNKRPRATLRIIRAPPGMDLGDSDDDWEDEDSDDEELNGGPSDKEKARKLKELAALREMEEDEDEDDEDDEDEEFDLKAAISKLVKGKAPATDDDEEDDESDEGLDLEETVVCTLDPAQVGFNRYLVIFGTTLMMIHCRPTSNLWTSLSPRMSASSSRSLVPTRFT